MSDRRPPSQTSNAPKKKRSFWRLFKSHKKSSSSLQQSAQATSTAWLDEEDQAEARVRGSPITASACSLQQSAQASTAWLDEDDQAEARVRGSPITASAGSLRPALQCRDSADRPSPLVARGATLTEVLDRHQDQVPDLVASHLVDDLGPSSGDPECVDLLLQPDFPSADHRLPCEESDTRENDENANLEQALIESCGQTTPRKIIDGGMSNFCDGSSVGNFNSDFIFRDGRSPWSRATHSQHESSDESGSGDEEEEEEEEVFYDALVGDDLGEQFRCETDMKEPRQTATPRGHRTDWSSAIVAVGVAVAIPFFVLVGILHGIYSLFRWGSNVCGQVAGESRALGTTAARGYGAEQRRDRARPGGPPESAAGTTRPWNACCPRVPSDIRLLLLLIIFPFLIPFMFLGHQNSSSSSSNNNNGITSSSPPGVASAGPWRSLRKFVSWLPRRRNATPSSVASPPVTWGAIRGVTRALSAFSQKPRPTFSMARSHHRRGRPCRCRCNKCNIM